MYWVVATQRNRSLGVRYARFLQKNAGLYWQYSVCCLGLLGSLLAPFFTVQAQTTDNDAQALLRQQERERAVREQLEAAPQTRLPRHARTLAKRLPEAEAPCFVINQIQLTGEEAARFNWALAAADPSNDPALLYMLHIMKVVKVAYINRGKRGYPLQAMVLLLAQPKVKA